MFTYNSFNDNNSVNAFLAMVVIWFAHSRLDEQIIAFTNNSWTYALV